MPETSSGPVLVVTAQSSPPHLYNISVEPNRKKNPWLESIKREIKKKTCTNGPNDASSIVWAHFHCRHPP